MANFPFPFSRARARFVLLTLSVFLLAPAATAGAFTPAKGGNEDVPLNMPKTTSHTAAASSASSGGPSIVRTIVGLAIVLGVIWGLTWVLKQMKSGRESRAAGTGLESVATLPLGSGRSLHLVRAGNDHLVVGSAEQGVVPVFRYTEEQARAAGLVADDDPFDPEHTDPGAGAERRAGRERGAGGTHDPGRLDPGRSAIQIPGHNEGVLERLREWTVRR
jgi:flagellar protein FliO/FliZ